MIERSVIEAFNLMWGPFPEPVMLIQKDRTILAVNQAAQAYKFTAGSKCSSLNPENAPDTRCKHCKALVALHKGQPVSAYSERGGKHMKGYWMPLQGVEDVYVHFGINIAEEINAALERAKSA